MGSRRSKYQIEVLEQQIIDALAEDHPQSVRHVFYRMTDPRLPEPVDKTHLGYRQVQDRVLKMRRQGKLPYTWIADASRTFYGVATYTDLDDFLGRVQALYRQDIWHDVGKLVEVWCESESLAGVLMETTYPLAVRLYPSKGFASETYLYQAAEYIELVGYPTWVYYVGDYDPAGALIDGAKGGIENKLRGFLPDDYPLWFDRLAINEDQIAEYNLPTKPRKTSEKRRPDIKETVEAETMPAAAMRRLVREHIEEHLPADWLVMARAEEEAARSTLERFQRMLA